VLGSFIPPKDLRDLRGVSRYRRKLIATCPSQTDRLRRMLGDGGISAARWWPTFVASRLAPWCSA
jgi:hypothetical protein